eukprot:gene12883-14113_t
MHFDERTNSPKSMCRVNCLKCAIGTYQSSSSFTGTVCTQCSSPCSTNSTGAVSSTSCYYNLCPVGQYQTICNAACLVCPVGQTSYTCFAAVSTFPTYTPTAKPSTPTRSRPTVPPSISPSLVPTQSPALQTIAPSAIPSFAPTSSPIVQNCRNWGNSPLIFGFMACCRVIPKEREFRDNLLGKECTAP